MTHPVGKYKAKLFRSWGYNDININIFENQLRRIAKNRKVINSRQNDNKSGINYVVDGKIAIPKGGIKRIRTIWCIEANQENAHLVTVSPLD